MRNTAAGLVIVIGVLLGGLPSPVSGAPSSLLLRQAQERLHAAGFDPGPLDGTLGPRTREALRHYQAAQGLPVTGELDPATRHTLGVQPQEEDTTANSKSQEFYFSNTPFGRSFALDDPQYVQSVDASTLGVPQRVKVKDAGGARGLLMQMSIGYRLALVPVKGLPQAEFESTHSFAGTEHTYLGKVQPWRPTGVTFLSSAHDPLTFRLDVTKGWVYLEGRGQLLQGGKIVAELPRQEPLQDSPALLLQDLGATYWKTQCDAMWALSQAGETRAIAPALRALKNADWAVRKCAAQALGSLQASEAKSLLVEALQDQDREVRRRAAWALGQLRDASVWDALSTVVRNDADLWVRTHAAFALGKLDRAKTLSLLLPLRKAKDEETRFLAGFVLDKLGP